MEIFFSAALLFKFTKLKDNFLIERSKIGTEINFVSRTEIHLFMTRDLNYTIQTTPPNSTSWEGANSNTGNFPPAVRIKNTLVGAFFYFYQILSVRQIRVFPEKKNEKNNREILRTIEKSFNVLI